MTTHTVAPKTPLAADSTPLAVDNNRPAQPNNSPTAVQKDSTAQAQVDNAEPDTATLTVWRTHFSTNATLGALYINGKFFCHTLEPRTRPKGAPKIPGKTAIPEGRYRLSLNVASPRFSDYKHHPWARPWSGKMPFLCNVPGFNGVLIHVGNTPNDTSGCLLVGQATAPDFIVNSIATFRRLMLRLQRHPHHIPLYISVRNHPQSRLCPIGYGE